MSRTLTARRLLTDIGTIEFPVLSITSDGTIAEIISDPQALREESTTLTAAFFDIHLHGATGIDVMNSTPAEFRSMQKFLATHGVANYLPTTVTAPVDFTLRALERMADAIERIPADDEARPRGIHIEGPFLSHAKRGMHPAEDLQPPSVELFERFQSAARGYIRLVTIAPEPNTVPSAGESRVPDENASSVSALELIRHVTGKGVRCSIGHTNATAAETLAAIKAGAVSATHTFNAMRSLDHREPGVLGTVLDQEQLYADLICDGVHVTPAAVRLWFKAKGPGRAILITDALSATGMHDGNYVVGSGAVTVHGIRALVSKDLSTGKETLAGSVLTLDRAVANLREFTGAALGDAVRLASHNPAAMMGKEGLTRVAPGAAANLNRFDERGRLLKTYLRGVEVRRET
jgi:N-acetylglucosamine-6-phosphate deacetylase